MMMWRLSCVSTRRYSRQRRTAVWKAQKGRQKGRGRVRQKDGKRAKAAHLHLVINEKIARNEDGDINDDWIGVALIVHLMVIKD